MKKQQLFLFPTVFAVIAVACSSAKPASDDSLYPPMKRPVQSAPVAQTEPNMGDDGADLKDSDDGRVSGEPEIVKFEWCPKSKVKKSYLMDDPADQHRIVYMPGVQEGKSYPVVIGFHGQPGRGKDPQNYSFMGKVQDQVTQMVKNGEIEPIILVLPVFRYRKGNWPAFSPDQFKIKIEELLEEKNISSTDYYAFGHSGAAGCGGAGLNHAHLMEPMAVGFFDTCLGKSWQKEVHDLQKAKVKTLNIHSVETAGFKPRQRPEYQADFDFGRAYGPIGINPIECPDSHPGDTLRDQEYKCAATDDGIIEAFVIDTGEGVEAHRAMLEPALAFFLVEFCGLKK